jgi:mannitol/fructose-specific phosphotransferase system IIA component (Ntr-type)
VRICFLLVGPETEAGAHVKALSRIARVVRRESVRERLTGAVDVEEFLRVLDQAEAA